MVDYFFKRCSDAVAGSRICLEQMDWRFLLEPIELMKVGEIDSCKNAGS
jgi:hypothetical protein